MVAIAVAGIGYVGLSNAVLLAQHNDVVAYDISERRVAKVNARHSPIADAEIEAYLATKPLRLKASSSCRCSSRVGRRFSSSSRR